MAEEIQGSQGSEFISYSRKDKVFVKELNDALDGAGVQSWVDWEGIELASNWMQTITTAIQTHDAFIFVISPDSIKSKVCTEELELGLKLNKKLFPNRNWLASHMAPIQSPVFHFHLMVPSFLLYHAR